MRKNLVVRAIFGEVAKTRRFRNQLLDNFFFFFVKNQPETPY